MVGGQITGDVIDGVIAPPKVGDGRFRISNVRMRCRPAACVAIVGRRECLEAVVVRRRKADAGRIERPVRLS